MREEPSTREEPQTLESISSVLSKPEELRTTTELSVSAPIDGA